MRVRLKSQMLFIITPLMEELLKRIKMFWICDMWPNKFDFLTLVRKIRTRGATESQSLTSNIIQIWPSTPG